MEIDTDYDSHPDTTKRARAADPWDNPQIRAYLEQSRRTEQERIDAALVRIDDQLAARKALHDDLMAELEWEYNKYEQEFDRLSTPFASKTTAREQVTARLREVGQQLRNERRAHWRDCQRLKRERRDLLRERAALLDEDLSELL